MRIYRIEPTLNATEAPGAFHDHVLPGIQCDACGEIWSQTGVSYPSLTDVGLLQEISNLQAPVLSVTHFNVLRRKICRFFDFRYFGPGTSVGPIGGKFDGRFNAVVWPTPWCPLVPDVLLGKRGAKELKLTLVKSNLLLPADQRGLMFEIEATPTARLRKCKETDICGGCGRANHTVPDKIIIDRKTFNRDLPLQRVLETPTVLVANADCASFLKSEGWGGLTIREMELA
jgi:Protein of unknown function (Gmx_para_CXXCG)